MLNRQKCQNHDQLQDELDVGLLKHFRKVARALTGRRPVRPAADDDFDTKMPQLIKDYFLSLCPTKCYY